MTRVLICDDNPTDLAVAERAVHGLLPSADVVAVDGGEAAVRELRGPATFDLVLADYFMGAVSGADVLHFARGLSPRPRVVVMSGEPAAVRAACRRADAVIDKEHLIEELTRAARPRRRRRGRGSRGILVALSWHVGRRRATPE